MLVAAVDILDDDPGFLFAVMPFIVCGLLFAGAFLLTVLAAAVVSLLNRQSRLPAIVIGAVAMLAGTMMTGFDGRTAAEGVLVTGCGVALLVALIGPGAARETGPLIALPSLRAYVDSGATPWWELWSDGISAGLTTVEWVETSVLVVLFVTSQVLLVQWRFTPAVACLACAAVLAAHVESNLRRRRR